MRSQMDTIPNGHDLCSLSDLGKCKIAQTSLDKRKFAKKNSLGLHKTEKNLPNCKRNFPQSLSSCKVTPRQIFSASITIDL